MADEVSGFGHLFYDDDFRRRVIRYLVLVYPEEIEEAGVSLETSWHLRARSMVSERSPRVSVSAREVKEAQVYLRSYSLVHIPEERPPSVLELDITVPQWDACRIWGVNPLRPMIQIAEELGCTKDGLTSRLTWIDRRLGIDMVPSRLRGAARLRRLRELLGE